MDDIRFYDRVLNADEINALYHEGGWNAQVEFVNIIEDQVVCKEDTVTFEVMAAGILPIYYQWQKDGINITAASNSVLILPNVQDKDTGEYRCIATNDYGTDTSNTAILTIEFSTPTIFTGDTSVLEYQVAIYSVMMQQDHLYEFLVDGGNIIDETENSITVHWGAAGQGFIKLIETSELGCIADTNILRVNIGNLGVNDIEEQKLSVYPNPSSGAACLRLVISDQACPAGGGGLTILDLYSISGQKIKRLLKEEKIPGTYEMEIEVRDLPAGIYIVRLVVGDFIRTKKLVLIDDN
jgi:hypothetical protein